MRRSPYLAAVLALALAAGGCDTWYNDVPSPDDLMHNVPWFDHMITSRSPHPYSRADIPRGTPPGTVPVTGGEVDWSAEWATGNTATADRQVNPTSGAATARGDTLYQVYCAVCHGPTGRGDGPVGPRVAAPPLLTESARGRSDGYLYSILRYGRGIMGKYGDKIPNAHDRWQVVNYVRTLQAAVPAAAPVGGGNR